jgi:serine/threonine protein kinase/dienelactone hydrolase
VTVEDKNEEDIFRNAIGFEDRDEQAGYVKRACGDDTELRAAVEALLQYHYQSSILDAPALESSLLHDTPPITEGPGAMIGRYRLLEKIGEGGMAVVYMAEQTEPIRRKVALKIIKLGMDTKSVIARFEAERQALAMMDHPNIAKVLDAGATETGRPYFVMELVTGVSITEYCDKNNLSTKERLTLFIQVCNAVQHAHQKGIIHRDIKPTNVMVTRHEGRPVPKVIDFGIVKAINQKLTEKTLFTRYAHIIGTPAYMSPEQADLGDPDVDTRSDIYSLGVLLYELLTGTTPFSEEELRKAGYLEMQRVIREQEPPKPSTKLSTLGETLTDIAKCRGSTPDLLTKTIRGDLDWIVIKSLEKDRTRRYETSHALAEDIERHLKNEPILAGSPGMFYRLQKFVRRHRSHLATATVVTVLAVGLAITAVKYRRTSRLEWAKGEALPRIVELVQAGEISSAFPLAQELQKVIPNDPTLINLWPRISKVYSINTTPAGAQVFCREYSDQDGPWHYLGRSPLKDITLANCIYRWKIEKQGFDTHECVSDQSIQVRLRETDLAGEMAWIDGWRTKLHQYSYAHVTSVEVPGFWMDKYEVTNEQFQDFVNAGGYTNAEYWEGLDFIKDGRQLSWQEVMGQFKDQTGQPGPFTWEDGTYPQGQERYPVSGVSWFEAMAYARFSGKSLPTVHHWKQAACLWQAFVIIPFSNLEFEGTAPVGSHPGMGYTGLYDMAGNVKEWCLNATDDSGHVRYLLGGGWGEPTYMFTEADSREPWDRSRQNGFRCVRYAQGEASPAQVLFRSLNLYPMRDLSDLESFSDEEFRSFKAQYQYDQTPLHPKAEKMEDSSPFWHKERITFDAAYDGERMIAYLFLPRKANPPYQTVIYFPGAGAVYDESFDDLESRKITEYIITSGRALLYPIYYGTYERPAARGRVWDLSSIAQTPLAYRDWAIKMVKDLRRCIEYLETRPDLDSDRVAYYGMCLGGAIGPIMLAVEGRIKTGIFLVGGIPAVEIPRSVDVALYAERVTVPVLMVNGKEDFLVPKMASYGLYERLGTPDEQKEYKSYPGGHGIYALFYKQIQADVLAWLDRYLGPVE